MAAVLKGEIKVTANWPLHAKIPRPSSDSESNENVPAPVQSSEVPVQPSSPAAPVE